VTAPVDTGRGERYDAAYFDKWDRHPVHRVKSAAELARQVAFVLHTAEWVLGRRVRTVLDVGCGEGHWYPALRALRPRIAYAGVNPADWKNRQGMLAAFRPYSFPYIIGFDAAGVVDTRTSLEVLDLLQRLNAEGITVVLVTHEHDIAACAKRVLRMRDGRIQSDVRTSSPTIAAEALRELPGTEPASGESSR
jgi:SAM-dependent methyltransferase